MLDAWQSSDPYTDLIAQGIGYAMLKDNTIWTSGFNNIVFKKNGIYWETLTGVSTFTGYKYLAQAATYNGYSLNIPAIIYSDELFVKQAYSFINGTFNVLMNIDKSKFYWYYNMSNFGASSLTVRGYVDPPVSTYCNYAINASGNLCYSSYYSLNNTKWNNTLPLLNVAQIIVNPNGCAGASYYWSNEIGAPQGINFANGVLFQTYMISGDSCS